MNVDGNLVTHLLESFASQEGLSGPASNLLRELGAFFPAAPPSKARPRSPAAPHSRAAPQPPRLRHQAAPPAARALPSAVEYMYELD